MLNAHSEGVKTSLCFLFAVCLVVCGLQPLRAADNVAPAGPEGVEWSLQEIQGKPARGGDRGRPTLKLDGAKNQASGFAGVNRFFGGYEKTGEKLKFGALAWTMMAGPPEEMGAETAYHAALADVSHWRIAEGALELLKDKTVLLRFTAGKDGKKKAGE